MRQILTTILLLTLIIPSLNAQSETKKVKVTKIDSTESFYFIKGKIKDKPRSRIIIISERDASKSGGKKIMPKGVYELKLMSYYSDEYLKELPAKRPGTLKLKEDGYIVWNGKGDMPYRSPNVKSLYYFE